MKGNIDTTLPLGCSEPDWEQFMKTEHWCYTTALRDLAQSLLSQPRTLQRLPHPAMAILAWECSSGLGVGQELCSSSTVIPWSSLWPHLEIRGQISSETQLWDFSLLLTLWLFAGGVDNCSKTSASCAMHRAVLCLLEGSRVSKQGPRTWQGVVLTVCWCWFSFIH